MDNELATAIDKWRREPFVWGVSDCILSVCDYVLDVTGVDPAEPWRGSYHNVAGATAIYAQYGGVLALFDYGMGRAGFDRGECKFGSPVVCHIQGHQIAGVKTRGGVSFRMERGVYELRANVLGAWVI